MYHVNCPCGNTFQVEGSGCYICKLCNKIKCTVFLNDMKKAVVNFETITNPPKPERNDLNK